MELSELIELRFFDVYGLKTFNSGTNAANAGTTAAMGCPQWEFCTDKGPANQKRHLGVLGGLAQNHQAPEFNSRSTHVPPDHCAHRVLGQAPEPDQISESKIETRTPGSTHKNDRLDAMDMAGFCVANVLYNINMFVRWPSNNSDNVRGNCNIFRV